MTYKFKLLVSIFFLLFLSYCGKERDRSVSSRDFDEMIPEDSLFDPAQEFEEEGRFYTENESLDLSDYGFESVELLMGLKTACDAEGEEEVFCHILSQEAKDAIEILGQKIRFKTQGQYLFRAKKKDDHEKIFMTPVLPWDVEEESQEESQSVLAGHLRLYKDTFYNMLYHARLTFNQKPEWGLVQWEITGGRYHIYDNEYGVFQRVRPFEKSILFLEKKDYQVKAIVTEGVNRQKEIITQVDLTHAQMPTSVAAILHADSYEPQISEKVNFKIAWQETPKESVSFEWEAKKIGDVSCPEIMGIEAEAREILCEQFFEIPLVEGEDYEIAGDREGNRKSDHVAISFKKLGQYVVHVRVRDDETQEISKYSRHLKLSPVMVSHR